MVNECTNFNPQVNGFKFINYFQLPKSISLDLPFIHLSSISLPNLVYGLCGGMCYSALDYYYAGKTILADTAIPTNGVNLSQSTGEPLYGFFVTKYQAQMPP